MARPTRSGSKSQPRKETKRKTKAKPKVPLWSDSDSEPGASTTPERSTVPEPGTEPETDSDSEPSKHTPAQVLAPDEDREPAVGQFLVLGVFSGKTRNGVVGMMERHGAVMSKDKTSGHTSHIVMSESVWHTHASSEAIRHYIKTNKENAESYPDDPDRHRVWFLPLEWVTQSIAQNSLAPESDHDFEKLADAKRKAREDELAEERKHHGGKSVYKRGERRKLETQRREQDLEKQLQDEFGTTTDDTSDEAKTSPAQSFDFSSSGHGGRPGNPLQGYNYNPAVQRQSKINAAFFGRAETLGGSGMGSASTSANGGGARPSAGGAAGPWSGVGVGPRPVGGLGGSSAAWPRNATAGPPAQPQPKSLGAIELSSGEGEEEDDDDDDDDLSVVSAAPPPPSKKRKVAAEVVEGDAGDDYDW